MIEYCFELCLVEGEVVEFVGGEYVVVLVEVLDDVWMVCDD